MSSFKSFATVRIADTEQTQALGIGGKLGLVVAAPTAEGEPYSVLVEGTPHARAVTDLAPSSTAGSPAPVMYGGVALPGESQGPPPTS